MFYLYSKIQYITPSHYQSAFQISITLALYDYVNDQYGKWATKPTENTKVNILIIRF